jgi:hypothetical protein
MSSHLRHALPRSMWLARLVLHRKAVYTRPIPEGGSATQEAWIIQQLKAHHWERIIEGQQRLEFEVICVQELGIWQADTANRVLHLERDPHQWLDAVEAVILDRYRTNPARRRSRPRSYPNYRALAEREKSLNYL